MGIIKDHVDSKRNDNVTSNSNRKTMWCNMHLSPPNFIHEIFHVTKVSYPTAILCIAHWSKFQFRRKMLGHYNTRTSHEIAWYLPISVGRFLSVLRLVLTALGVKRQFIYVSWKIKRSFYGNFIKNKRTVSSRISVYVQIYPNSLTHPYKRFSNPSLPMASLSPTFETQ